MVKLNGDIVGILGCSANGQRAMPVENAFGDQFGEVAYNEQEFNNALPSSRFILEVTDANHIAYRLYQKLVTSNSIWTVCVKRHSPPFFFLRY